MAIVTPDKLVNKENKKDSIIVLSYDGHKEDHSRVKSELVLRYYNYSFDISSAEFKEHGGYFTADPQIKKEVEELKLSDPSLNSCKFVQIYIDPKQKTDEEIPKAVVKKKGLKSPKAIV